MMNIGKGVILVLILYWLFFVVVAFLLVALDILVPVSVRQWIIRRWVA